MFLQTNPQIILIRWNTQIWRIQLTLAVRTLKPTAAWVSEAGAVLQLRGPDVITDPLLLSPPLPHLSHPPVRTLRSILKQVLKSSWVARPSSLFAWLHYLPFSKVDGYSGAHRPQMRGFSAGGVPLTWKNTDSLSTAVLVNGFLHFLHWESMAAEMALKWEETLWYE